MNINIIKKIFGSRNDRLIKRMSKSVNLINSLESSMQSLSDQALAAKTIEYRERLDREEPLDNLLPEAFATVREAARRTLNMRHFDVQLIGGIVLHQGQIAEMRTGEGKTLVATLPVYLNALPGKGVHVITVNDYLARRDAEWMGQIYHFLGLTVGVTIAGLSNEQKRASYSSDVSYGTNNEFGFDYLRDNMAFGVQDRMQRPLHYAIVDEVDSILIDEARTPLIISGPTDDNSDLYRLIDEIVPDLKPQARAPKTDDEVEVPGDFYVDEKGRQVVLSDEGHQHVEELLTKAGILKPNSSLYDPANIMLMHHVSAALRAHKLFQRNVDYIVTNNQIVIVDEFTGRTMPGRRWSEGLHQAIEAREGVAIQNENQTLAGITFQNLFRLYKKLSGMTGTADTEAYEFQQIYGLEVVVIPTHHPMIRDDKADLVFLTAKEKYRAILEDIRDCRARGQPVLVGTASIENSETLAAMLQQENILHQVLNAKFHEHEAMIIAQAGRPGAVTIATNMAGRGTDIVLGGNVEGEIKQLGPDLPAAEAARLREEWQRRHEAVIKSGGLHIIGTERHESRRIDNQLRGRSGRQGDPGSSRFYLSLEDSLMRIFASERVSGLMQKLGMPEGEAIEHRWVTKAIENAQRKVEGRNFDIRKQLLEYDDIANDQRKIIYEQRSELMESESIADTIKVIRQDVVNDIINAYISPNSLEELWNIPSLETALAEKFLVKLPIAQWLQEDSSLHEQSLRQKILEILTESYELKEKKFGDKVVRHLEKVVMLQVLDTHWKEHLAAMDYLRQGIHLRGIAQKNPKYEFKREAFQMFQTLLEQIKQEVIETLHKVEIRTQEEVAAVEAQEEQRRQAQALQYQHSSLGVFGGAAENMPQDRGDASPVAPRPYVRPERKVGRNESCPCGSGKKFKHCHGKLD